MQQGIGLCNTTHSEVAPCLPLPSLPVFCGASDQDLRLLDEPSKASRIADLLRATDVSYLNLKENAAAVQKRPVQPMQLHDEVLQYNPEAFQYHTPVSGPIKGQVPGSSSVPDKKVIVPIMPTTRTSERDYGATHNKSEPEMSQDEETRPESEIPQDDEMPEMAQDDENGVDSPALVDRNQDNCMEVLTEEHNQALVERDLALNELNNLRTELKEVQDYRSRALAESELNKKVAEAEKKALTERLDKELSNFAAELKEVLESLSKSKAELEQTSQERDSYRNSLELEKKEWEDEKKALTERLNKEFNNFGAELNKVLKNLSKSEAELEKTSQERDTYRNSLELGNKVWEAERIEMEKKVAMVNKEKENALELGKKVAEAGRKEMAENTAMTNKEKEKAYCKGYLDGWLKKPHAYVHAWHDARLDSVVTDLPVLQMMNKLPKSHV